MSPCVLPPRSMSRPLPSPGRRIIAWAAPTPATASCAAAVRRACAPRWPGLWNGTSLLVLPGSFPGHVVILLLSISAEGGELVSRRGQKYQAKMFRRKQRFAPFHQKGRGIPYESNLSEYKSVVRRSVMLLLEFQISGAIAKRLPKGDYDIPGGLNAAGNRFIEFLEGSNFAPGTIYNYRMYIFRAISFFANHGASSFENLNNDLINLYMKTFAGYSKPYISTTRN